MRCRYCSTIFRDEVRPSFMAFCISGIVASTTLKGGAAGCGVEVVQAAAAAARKRTERRCFMAGILFLESKHLRVLHHQAAACGLGRVGELRLVVDDEEIAERTVNQVEADVGRELLHVVAILQERVEEHVRAEGIAGAEVDERGGE